MTRLCTLLLAVVWLAGCAARREVKTAPPAAPPVGHTYVGVLPCEEGCRSVRTELTLFDHNHRFSMEETFLGVPGGDQSEMSFGEWEILRGHGNNPAAEVLELTSEQFEEERYFLRVGPDQLRALDRQGDDIKTRANVILKRISNR